MGSQPRLTDPASRSRSHHAIIAHARARDMNHLPISRQFLSKKQRFTPISQIEPSAYF